MLSESVVKLEKENVKLQQMVLTLQTLLEEKQVKPRHCEECKHFLKHYILDSRRGYVEVGQGHCTRDRKVGKNRSVEDSCKDFEFGKYE